MGLLGSETFNSLDDLFLHELEDIYDAENRLTKALPKMRDAATEPKLREAFDHHLRETEHQIERLDIVFKTLNKKPERETCAAMKGLISEGQDMIDAKGDDHAKDAALIAAAQRVEHYEMAAYGTVHTLALRLGNKEAAKQLKATLDEEKSADAKLTEIAESYVNPAA